MDGPNQHLHGHDDVDGGVPLYLKPENDTSSDVKAEPVKSSSMTSSICSIFVRSNAPAVKYKLDPRANPYLSHHYHDQSNSYGGGGMQNGSWAASQYTAKSNGSFSNMRRHKTTAAQGKALEDGPTNAFTGRPLTQQYMNILKGRRNLPVYAQRLVFPISYNEILS